MLLEFLQWLQFSPLLVEMRASPWFFPLVASLHLLGLTLVGGAVLLVDLRLLGWGLTRQPASELAHDARPWLFAGLAIMFPTGILLFLCFATKYYYLTAFWVKVASLVLVLAFTFTLRRRAVVDDAHGSSPVMRKLVALVSLSLWTTIALAGRLIGFP